MSDFVETVKEAMILGSPTYVIPFMFITHPELLEWDLSKTVVVATFFGISMLALIVALTGIVGQRRIPPSARLAALALFAVIGFAPIFTVQAVAAAAFVGLVSYLSTGGLVTTLSNIPKRWGLM